MLASVVAPFVCGCRTISESNLIGVYQAESPCVTASLALNKDHSFEQSLRTRSGETKRVMGKWKLMEGNSSFAGKQVSFSPSFLDMVHDSQGVQVGGATLAAEGIGFAVHSGPIIVACPETSYKIDYVK